MRTIKYYLLLMLIAWVIAPTWGHINPDLHERERATANYRMDCAPADSEVDQNINNVRARLLAGGDVWWDGDDGLYIVPNVGAGVAPVSSLFAGAVWLGGVDPAGNLKVAAQTYGTASGNTDFWPGPLDPNTGTVDAETCENWDQQFKVLGSEIDLHIANFAAVAADTTNPAPEVELESIAENILGWPARGNQHFFAIHDFELPNTVQGLAPFWDENGNGLYDPEFGDYPIIEIRGCSEPQYPDEMFFWIYNDAGGVHTETNADAIQMEIQVQAFAYATNDQLNDMTFQRYKLINRAVESIDSTFFAMWTDPDLGCFVDDYVGCDTVRSLMYVYNEDAADGDPGCTCQGGVNTYCTNIPILGVDYFRGPLGPRVFRINGEDTTLVAPAVGEFPDTLIELGMSSFVYYNNGAIGNPDPATTDPNGAVEYYRYLTGSWRNGSPITEGGNGFGGLIPTKFVFPDSPSDPNGWSMYSESLQNGDRRTLQASGPFRLDPGAVNELIVGVPWVADQNYPGPDIADLQFADDISQALFDNCFDITDGPDAPDMCIVELDKEIIFTLSNRPMPVSNNGNEEYQELDLRAPGTIEDNKYVFEGYRVFQVIDPGVSVSDLDDPEKAKEVFQCDIRNDASTLYNWSPFGNPDPDAGIGDSPTNVWIPELQVEGENEGVRKTFRITEDLFATSDPKLVNHRKYYFLAIAYAYNNYSQFNANTEVGQQRPYLAGRRNIQVITAIPRPITDQSLLSYYGDGAIVTRLDGVGAGGNFLDISTEERESMVDGSFDGEITYEPGQAPIEVKVYDPLRVQDGEYILSMVDEDMSNDRLDDKVRWELRKADDSDFLIASERTIDRLNEQLIAEAGFSISIAQTDDAGAKTTNENGAIGQALEYTDPAATPWLGWLPDDTSPQLNYLPTSPGELHNDEDPSQAFSSQFGTGMFSPFTLSEYRISPTSITYSPAWMNSNFGSFVHESNPLSSLNNVDIVLTSDTSKWSRCVVVETTSPWVYDANLSPNPIPTEGDANSLELREAPSVGRGDANGDGLPDPDGDGTGMGWFPGYAVDVESGKRLNIFFGEASSYACDPDIGTTLFCDPDNDATELYEDLTAVGADMMWNPSSQFFLGLGAQFSPFSFIMGGHHYIYVTDQEYDECADIRNSLSATNVIIRASAYRPIKWSAMPIRIEGSSLLSYADGLIPSEVTMKLRVDNPYEVETGTDEANGYPTYRFKLENKATIANSTDEEVNSQLDMINAVPNPYYGFSDYEIDQFSNVIKITNLPAKCVVTIYSLDGKFIRQYNRNETEIEKSVTNAGVLNSQINPAIEWDLKNNKGIPVSSGVYLIHINADGLGERVIKWFGVARKFDASGL